MLCMELGLVQVPSPAASSDALQLPCPSKLVSGCRPCQSHSLSGPLAAQLQWWTGSVLF